MVIAEVFISGVGGSCGSSTGIIIIISSSSSSNRSSSSSNGRCSNISSNTLCGVFLWAQKDTT
jgi:hypothetical protein